MCSILFCLGLGLAASAVQSLRWYTVVLSVLCIIGGSIMVVAVLAPSYTTVARLRDQVTELQSRTSEQARVQTAMDVHGFHSGHLASLSPEDRAAVLQTLAVDQDEELGPAARRRGAGRGTNPESEGEEDFSLEASELVMQHVLQEAMIDALESVERGQARRGQGPASWRRARDRHELSLVEPRASDQAREGQALRIDPAVVVAVAAAGARRPDQTRSRHRPSDATGRRRAARAVSRLARAQSEPRVRGSDLARPRRSHAGAVLEAPADIREITDTDKDDCAVCMEPLKGGCARCLEANRGSRCGLSRGTCGHAFHACCIGDWVVSCAREGREPKCPVDNTTWRFRPRIT